METKTRLAKNPREILHFTVEVFMRLMQGTLIPASAVAIVLGLALLSGSALAQDAPASGVAVAAEQKTYTVPAGTKVLLQLRSGINTKSAKPGDGVYLVSTFPVVVGNKVMIPSGVYVQGVVDRVARAGRVKGRSQLDMHFTSIIFPTAQWRRFRGL